ncbi:MAG: hypothetical protein H0W84_08675, partial [Bacteroidetes bacterium]|nr:hypothetical protein [Bacteroidota bacterium]
VIGNKYIVDSSLPETTSFTLVDTLHGITMLFIFAVVACSVKSLKLIKANEFKKTKRFDKIASIVLISFYIILNVYFVGRACS